MSNELPIEDNPHLDAVAMDGPSSDEEVWLEAELLLELPHFNGLNLCQRRRLILLDFDARKRGWPRSPYAMHSLTHGRWYIDGGPRRRYSFTLWHDGERYFVLKNGDLQRVGDTLTVDEWLDANCEIRDGFYFVKRGPDTGEPIKEVRSELTPEQEAAIAELRQRFLSEPGAKSFLVQDPGGVPPLVTIAGLGQWRVWPDGRVEPFEFVTPYTMEFSGTPWPITGHPLEGFWRCELGEDGFWYKRERVAKDPETGEWRIVEPEGVDA
jgi:hypothetical protein